MRAAILHFMLLVTLCMACQVEREKQSMSYDYYPGYQPGFEFMTWRPHGKPKCNITLSEATASERCLLKRINDVKSAQLFYNLTLEDGLLVLNRTFEELRYHTAIDPIDSRWLILYSTFQQAAKGIHQEIMKNFGNKPFTKFKEYKQTYSMLQQKLGMLTSHHYFSNPAMENTFTDFLDNDHWMTDEMFVQQRLAGPCPFLIKRVTMTENIGISWNRLKELLNPYYSFDDALNSASYPDKQTTLEEAIKRGSVYVLYHEMEYTNGERDSKDEPKHISNSEPIALFVNTLSADLKVFAIQWDSHPDSVVYSPLSYKIDWLYAKAMVNLVDSKYCNDVWRVSHLHLSSSIFCNTFRRHLSELHPLHHIMRYHCEGTVPANLLTYKKTVKPKLPVLVKKGIETFEYGRLSYNQILNRHGLRSSGIKYYPFRDDGKLIWREIHMFSKEFVDLYYKSDSNIVNDMELQGLVNELAADGRHNKKRGKNGRILKFPTKFTTRKHLETFILRFVWQIIMNAVVTYSSEPWATFVPLAPPKLYHSTMTRVTQNMAYGYPNAMVTLKSMSKSIMLGNFRINRIMGHFEEMKDEKLRTLVEKYYYRLHSCVQNELEKKNKIRKNKGLMGLQHLEPKWLTNSIHI